MPDDQIRFGDVSGGGGGSGLGGVIDLLIQLIVLAVVVFAGYKIIEAMLMVL